MSKQKRAPINTAQEAKENPLGVLAEAMVFGPEESVLRQEAEGQQSFVNSETLPVKMSIEDRKALEKSGVKFGERAVDDEIFQHVEFPTGWKKVPTGHPMWSKLVDDKGRERAAIFYKAAFYDRSAHLSTTRRYNHNFDYERLDKDGVASALITDGGKTIHVTEPISVGNRASYEVSDEAKKLAEMWLDTQYPNWRDASAYWD